MASTQNEKTNSRRDDRSRDAGVEVVPVSRGLVALDRSIFAALLCLIPLTSILYGTVEAWWEAAFECVIFGLVGLWLIEGLVRGTWDVHLPGLAVPVFAFIGYALIQTITIRDAASGWQTISADPYTTRLFALKLLALLCVGLLLARYTSSPRRLRALIYVVIVTAVSSAIFGIVRETTQHNSIGFILPQLRPGSGYGQFINRNHFAYLMEMALGLGMGLLVGKSEKRTRLLYLAAMLPIVIALVLANSRGGILSMFSQVLFLLLMVGGFSATTGSDDRRNGLDARSRNAPWRLLVRIVLIACLLGAMVVGVLWIGGDPLTKRLETLQGEVKNEDADTEEGGRRQEIWRATWKIIKEHPVTGVGFGGYWVAVTEYYDVPGQKRPYQAHNDYLELVASGGLIGALLGIWFIAAFFKRARLTLQARDAFRRSACLAALTGLFGIAVHSIVDFGLHITINVLVCIVLIVIATTDKRVDQTRTRSAR